MVSLMRIDPAANVIPEPLFTPCHRALQRARPAQMRHVGRYPYVWRERMLTDLRCVGWDGVLTPTGDVIVTACSGEWESDRTVAAVLTWYIPAGLLPEALQGWLASSEAPAVAARDTYDLPPPTAEDAQLEPGDLLLLTRSPDLVRRAVQAAGGDLRTDPVGTGTRYLTYGGHVVARFPGGRPRSSATLLAAVASLTEGIGMVQTPTQIVAPRLPQRPTSALTRHL